MFSEKLFRILDAGFVGGGRGDLNYLQERPRASINGIKNQEERLFFAVGVSLMEETK
jgi:hypothetical protein